MKPVEGIAIELAALSLVLVLGPFVPRALPFAVYVLVAQLLSTYLVHCPAHYAVGRALGIRFRAIRVGRTTLANVLPTRFATLARHLPILTLSTDRDSMVRSSRLKVASMYASGTVASAASAFVVALAATAAEPMVYSIAAWGVALAYLLFDLVFSPRGGDLSRAGAALRMLSA